MNLLGSIDSRILILALVGVTVFKLIPMLFSGSRGDPNTEASRKEMTGIPRPVTQSFPEELRYKIKGHVQDFKFNDSRQHGQNQEETLMLKSKEGDRNDHYHQDNRRPTNKRPSPRYNRIHTVAREKLVLDKPKQFTNKNHPHHTIPEKLASLADCSAISGSSVSAHSSSINASPFYSRLY